MSNFKPGCWIVVDKNIPYYERRSGSEYRTFPTYRELKKNLKALLEETLETDGNGTKCLSVSRSKRGEWGEYFEEWELINNKPKKVKEGWM